MNENCMAKEDFLLLKPGDEVIVRARDDLIKEYSSDNAGGLDMPDVYFNRSMFRYCGQTLVVNGVPKIDDRRYVVCSSHDHRNWWWSRFMLEPIKKIDINIIKEWENLLG